MELLPPEIVKSKEPPFAFISLIDVVFLLLIFFITAGIRRGGTELSLRLPESWGVIPAQQVEDRPWHKVVLTVVSAGKGGAYRLDDVVMAGPDALGGRLAELVKSDDRLLVVIADQPGAIVQDVARAIDICRQAGVENLTFCP